MNLFLRWKEFVVVDLRTLNKCS